MWIVLQLLALALGASGAPLWAHHPLPRESLAAAVVFSGQIIALALLFPLLLPNRITSLAVAVMALPFIQLGGLLSGTSETSLMAASAYVELWLVGLAFLAAILREPVAQVVGVSLT